MTDDLPKVCSLCQGGGLPPALAFLHQQLHAEPWPARYQQNLRDLPFALMPRVAQLMQDYADHMKVAREEPLC